jgi:hypothetical protein
MVMFFEAVVAATQLSSGGKRHNRGFFHLERGIGGAIIAPLIGADRFARKKMEVAPTRRKNPVRM